MFVPGVAAVRVSSIQLRIADSLVGVTVRILGVPRLTLTPRLGHTDGPSIVCPAVVVTLVIWGRGRRGCTLAVCVRLSSMLTLLGLHYHLPPLFWVAGGGQALLSNSQAQVY